MSKLTALQATFDVNGDPALVLERFAAQVPEGLTVIPLSHRQVSQGSANWNASAVVIGSPDRVAAASEGLLRASPKSMERLAQMRLQPGLDMLFTKSNGSALAPRMIQWIEYVFCEPKERRDYYDSQYDTSGPAMRELWDRGLVGRFLGFETSQVLYCSPGFPSWDVLHMIGITPWQLIRFMPRVSRTFDRYAKATGRGGRKKMFARWDEQRAIIKLTAKQPKKATRHSDPISGLLP